MTDWTDIHPDFTEELQREWEQHKFAEKQVEKWIEIAGLSPEDADFASYLRSKSILPDEADERLEELRQTYESKKTVRETIKNFEVVETKAVNTYQKRKIEEISDSDDRNWKNIKLDFTPELVREWKNRGFSYNEVKDWISVGIKTTEAEFCSWLSKVKKVDSEWILNHGKVEKLQSEYQQYLLRAQQIQNSWLQKKFF